jgi:hypothetical protein
MLRKTSRLIRIWFVAALAVMLPVAAFVAAVDAFGYFGTNRIGFYYSSEREFKQSMARGADYDAIVVGDSRVAYTDTSLIEGYRFLNGGVGGGTLPSSVALLRAARHDRIKVAVIALGFGAFTTVQQCRTPVADTGSVFDPIRYAASWTQFNYAVNALQLWKSGRRPYYHPDGTRDAWRKDQEDVDLKEPNANYWRVIDISARQFGNHRRQNPDGIGLASTCLDLLAQTKKTADQKGFRLLFVLLPINRDLLAKADMTDWLRTSKSRNAIAQLATIAPVVDFTDSAYSAPENFWLHDSNHFKPHIGARLLREAIAANERPAAASK